MWGYKTVPTTNLQHCHNKYEGCSKTIGLLAEKNTFNASSSATLIPFEVVSLWLNTLLPAVPPLFEAFLECLYANGVQLGRRVPYNVVSWLNSSPFQLLFQLGEQPKIARSHVGRVGSLSNHRHVFGQKSLNHLRGKSWYVVMMQLPRFADTLRMDKSSVKMECTEPVLISTSSASSRTVTRWSCMTEVRTWSTSSSSRLVEGLPERASLSTDVWPYLNRLYHSICVMPMASSPKTRWIFQMVSTWLSPSFWQKLMQYRCSSRSVIFAENNNATRAAYTLSHSHAGCTRLTLSAGGGKKTTYVHEGTIHLPTKSHLTCFISFRGKKIMSDTFWTGHIKLQILCISSWLYHVWYYLTTDKTWHFYFAHCYEQRVQGTKWIPKLSPAVLSCW